MGGSRGEYDGNSDDEVAVHLRVLQTQLREVDTDRRPTNGPSHQARPGPHGYEDLARRSVPPCSRLLEVLEDILEMGKSRIATAPSRFQAMRSPLVVTYTIPRRLWTR